MRILITGAAGFIGQHLTRELETDHDVFMVDRHHGVDLHRRGAIELALGMCKPNVVVHLAAKVGRLFGEDDVTETIRDNTGMTATVALRAHGIRLVYASTSEVYGDQNNMVCYEDGPLSLPHNAYGLSKRWGEEACRLYAPDGLTVWRISMPYRLGHPPGRGGRR